MDTSNPRAKRERRRSDRNDQVPGTAYSEFVQAVERVIRYLEDAEAQDYDCRHEPGQPHIYESVLVLKRWLDAAPRKRPAP